MQEYKKALKPTSILKLSYPTVYYFLFMKFTFPIYYIFHLKSVQLIIIFVSINDLVSCHFQYIPKLLNYYCSSFWDVNIINLPRNNSHPTSLSDPKSSSMDSTFSNNYNYNEIKSGPRVQQTLSQS